MSDFGLADEFVGVVHAVIARHAPGTTVVDLTHGIPPHDIRAGALALWRTTPWITPGVVLAVVDPGVGGDRRAVAVEAAPGTVLVGPDNGLLMPAARRLGGPQAAVELRPGPPAPGLTFAGRDVFAPAAARAAAGRPLADMGLPLDPATLVDLRFPEPARAADGTVTTEVLWIDRFGNAQLGVTPTEVDALRTVVATAAAAPFPAPVVASYDAVPAGGYALVVDSYGLLSICAAGRPAAPGLGLTEGAKVQLYRGGSNRP